MGVSKREFRTLVIEMVMATDMSCHFQQIKAMKTALQQPEAWVACDIMFSEGLDWNLHILNTENTSPSG